MADDLKWDKEEFKKAGGGDSDNLDDILGAGDVVTNVLLAEVEVNYSPTVQEGEYAVIVSFGEPIRVYIKDTESYISFIQLFVGNMTELSEIARKMKFRKDWFAAHIVCGLLSNTDFLRALSHLQGQHQQDVITNTIDQVYDAALALDVKAQESD